MNDVTNVSSYPNFVDYIFLNYVQYTALKQM